MPETVANINTVIEIAEKYQLAHAKINKLISDTQVEIGIRNETGTTKEGDLDVITFIKKLLDCLTM
jgi:hypothetical protein